VPMCNVVTIRGRVVWTFNTPPQTEHWSKEGLNSILGGVENRHIGDILPMSLSRQCERQRIHSKVVFFCHQAMMKKKVLYHFRFNIKIFPFELIWQFLQAQLLMLDFFNQNCNGFKFRWESLGFTHDYSVLELLCVTCRFWGKVHISALMLLTFNLWMVMEVPKEWTGSQSNQIACLMGCESGLRVSNQLNKCLC